jgi:hypothetical protein
MFADTVSDHSASLPGDENWGSDPQLKRNNLVNPLTTNVIQQGPPYDGDSGSDGQ